MQQASTDYDSDLKLIEELLRDVEPSPLDAPPGDAPPLPRAESYVPGDAPRAQRPTGRSLGGYGWNLVEGEDEDDGLDDLRRAYRQHALRSANREGERGRSKDEGCDLPPSSVL
jgi:hypothetical protein